ncbi:CUB and zona pellucida-like domain-containing protein 1 [Coregonus clupeaformis]|uniref:CUB and zona pellucida-like domain-containing protein 1 n=1 Tax=Coregonus clupeaformis TaxID=59861 RepID=UPI001BE0A44A|nr:CUB and zona pellucida-like domain-containing protein 1 [Coregonus clupeaformis]
MTNGQQEEFKERQQRPVQYYDTSAKYLTESHQDDKVRLQPLTGQKQWWQRATVVRPVAQKSYEVKTEQLQVIRRNRRHLRKSREVEDYFPTVAEPGTEPEEGDNLIFRNEITSFDDSSDVITRRHKVEIKFSCIYSKRGKVSLEFLANKILYIFREKGFGKFTYQFEFFHSSRFNTMVDPDSYPVEVDLKELVYMEITSMTSVPNTEMFVESCKATPSENPEHYSIIQNGCKKDKTVQIYSSSQSQFHFAMEAFKFIGMHDQVYISCAVILCEAENPNTRCAQGCVNGTHLHGRGAFLQTVILKNWSTE